MHNQAEALGEAAATMARVVGRLAEHDRALAALRRELSATRNGAAELADAGLELANQETAIGELRRQVLRHLSSLMMLCLPCAL